MIYAKVYLDKVGEDTFIVAESAIKNVDEKFCMLKGEHISKYGDPYEISKTRILSAKNAAISIEAKEMFKKLFAFENENKEFGLFIDDFVFTKDYIGKGEIDGEFAFRPDKGSINKRVFNVKNKIIINYMNFDIYSLDLMKIFDNETLKRLDITEPVEEESIK